MAIVWNPRIVLDVDPYRSFTCVGQTKKGARCRQAFFSNSDLRMASHLLDQMAASDPWDARARLRPLAEITLCPRWHREPGYSQVESMKEKWWSIIISTYEEPQSVYSSPISLPRNTARALRTTDRTSARQRLLTPSPSPSSRVTTPRRRQENATQALASNRPTAASLSLATPPSSPPSPTTSSSLLIEDIEQTPDSAQSYSPTRGLLTPPTSPPSPTPAPGVPQRSNAQALDTTMSSLSFSTPSSPPSPTPAPRHLRRNVRQFTASNEQQSPILDWPELPPLHLPELIPLLEMAQTLGILESHPASTTSSTPPIPLVEPGQTPMSSLRTDATEENSEANLTTIMPAPPTLHSPVLSRSSSNGSTASRASSVTTVVPIAVQPQSPRQATSPLDNNISNSVTLPTAIRTATASSSQTPPSTPSVPRRQVSETWQQLTLESPMQPSPFPHSHSSRLIPLTSGDPSGPEETKSLDDSVSCFTTCGIKILGDCSALWRNVSLGSKALAAYYVCCSPWAYELQEG